MLLTQRLGSRKFLYIAFFGAVGILLCARLGLSVYEGSWCWKGSRAQTHKRVEIAGDASTALTPLKTLLHRQGIQRVRGAKLEVDKSDRLMRLVISGKTVKTYVIALGINPDIKRERRGDCATPEGDYYVCEKNPRSQYYLSLKLAYPNLLDARRGLKEGLIDRRTYSAIERAISRGHTPPMDTKLGGDICIHGGGTGYLDKSSNPPVIEIYDWTQGCIALGKAEIKELFDLLPVGTKVHIDP